MAQDLRSVIRKIDDDINRESYQDAYKMGFEAIKEYDKERDFENSVSVLEKLIDLGKQINEPYRIEELNGHLLVRFLLMGKIDLAKNIDNVSSSEISLPILEFGKMLLNSHQDFKNSNYHLQSIERMSIFGTYVAVKNLPVLNFKSEDDAVRVLEYYFDDGRYIINLVQNATSLHHSVKIDIGKAQEINIVENKRVLRIK